MSLLKEYLNLVRDGLPNVDKIAQSLLVQVKSSYELLPSDEQEEIVRRKLICSNCPFFSLNLFNDDSEYRKLYGKPFESKRKNGKFCGICGCGEDMRTSCLSCNCGLESYNEKFPENKQELKWKSYEKTITK